MVSRKDRLLALLKSDDINEKRRATYDLEYADLNDKEILDTARHNIMSEDNELKAITIMRLLVRAKDKLSIDAALDAVRYSKDFYVVSNSALALANISREYQEIKPLVCDTLSRRYEETRQTEFRKVLRDSLSELN